MPAQSSCPGKLGVGLLLVLTACSNDPGALYCDPGQCPSDDAGGPPRAMPREEPPWLPALPDEGVRAECTACAKRECSTARNNCLEDDACTEQLECKSECWHPACVADCEAEHGFSPWYDDMWSCTFETCSAECGAGQNWACAGNYDWPPPESARLEVRFQFDVSVGGGAVGTTVRSCGATDPLTCSFPVDVATVAADNTVTLEVISGQSQSDFLELESPKASRAGFKHRYYPRPIVRPGAVRVLLGDRIVVAILSQWDLESPVAGQLLAFPTDCLGMPGVGVQVRLPDFPSVDLRHCSDRYCNQEEPSGSYAIAQLAATDLDRPLRVQAVHNDGGAILAERTILGRAGWVTQALLTPATASER